jgi:hypothetical protein
MKCETCENEIQKAPKGVKRFCDICSKKRKAAVNKKYRLAHLDRKKELDRQWKEKNRVRYNKRNNEYYHNVRKKRIDDVIYRCYSEIKNRCGAKEHYENIALLISREDFIQLFKSIDNCQSCGCILDSFNRNAINGKQIHRIDNSKHYERNNIMIICQSCHKGYWFIENAIKKFGKQKVLEYINSVWI